MGYNKQIVFSCIACICCAVFFAKCTQQHYVCQLKVPAPITSDKLLDFAKDSSFVLAKSKILQLASNNKEWTISFGKDGNRNVSVSEALSIGEQNTGYVQTNVPGFFADIHNHPGLTGPSAGDVYGLIKLNKKFLGYTMRFVIAKDSICFALEIFDTTKARKFLELYPAEVRRNIPSFPEKVLDDYRRIYGIAKFDMDIQSADAIGIAYVLQKYKTGIGLFKQVDSLTWVSIVVPKKFL